MLSSSHSIDYEFEDLYITIGGVRVNVYVSGSAELENDPGYTFVVKSITLDGTIKDRSQPVAMFLGAMRREATVTLPRPDKSDVSAEACMFRLLESGLNDDRGAIEAWQREVEEAAA